MRTLALLFLLALCLRVKRKEIQTLAQLVRDLPDELVAIIQPEHVVEYIHTHLPRTNPQTDSFIVFAFDEVLPAAAALVPFLRRSPSVLALLTRCLTHDSGVLTWLGALEQDALQD